MKKTNPHDEIKGSNPSLGAYQGVLRNIIKADESINSLPQNWDLNAQASTIDNNESYA